MRTWELGFRALRHAMGSAALLLGAGLTAAGAAPAPAPVLPQNGAFVAGQGQIGAPNAGALTINQQSAKGVIDWGSFSIGAGGAVTINNGAGATLNRVTGGALSDISGRLSATGSVYLVNPRGVVVSSTGQVLGGGNVVLSSRDIPTAGFMSGNTITASGNTAGDVTNAGSVVSKQGNVVLIGRAVTNSGDISATNGSVSLNAGSSVLMSDGAAGIYVAPDASATGDVTQDGQIQAAAASLTAAGGNVYALAGNRGGMIQATGTANVAGEVWLTAPNGDVNVAGKVVARNLDGGGGKIVAAGAGATTISGTLDASGLTGGTILAGVTAPQTNLSGSTTLLDTAQLVSTGTTGKGGYIETSGHTLALNSAHIETGLAGTFLIDPDNVVINATGTGSGANTTYLTASSINSQLAANGTVQVIANLDLTVASPITCSPCTTSSLDLEAARSMYITAPITIGGALKLVAATDLQQGNSQLFIGSDGNTDFTAPITARTVDINSQSTLIVKSNITSTGVGANDTMKLYAQSYFQVVNTMTIQSATGITAQAQYYKLEIDNGASFKAAQNIKIQTDQFDNRSDGTALQPGAGGNYYIYTTKPSQITLGGLTPNFVQYNATFDGANQANTTTPAGTGNGLLYSFAPVLQYTVTGNVSKIYDGNTTATGLSLSNITNITGLQTNDTLQMASSTGTFSQADVGNNIAVTLPTVSVVHTENNVTTPVYGYVVGATLNQGIIGTIKPAPLTVTVNSNSQPISKTYDGGTSALVSGSNLTVTGWKNGEGGAVTQVPSATYASANVGSPQVTIKLEASSFGNFTGGAKITNYTLDPTSATQVYNTPFTANGQITAAPLFVLIKGNPTVTQSGGVNPNATLSAANYDISGLQGSDAASVSQTVGVWDSTSQVGAQRLTAAMTGQISFSSGSASNYSLPATAAGFGTVKLTTPFGLGVNFIGTLTKTYDGTTGCNCTPGTKFTTGDFQLISNPGDVTLDPTQVTAITWATPNAGIQPFTITVNTARVNNNNYGFYKSTTYDISTAGTLQAAIYGQGTINKVSLTITGDPISKIYDGTSRGVIDASKLHISGTVNGETITLNSTVGTFQTSGNAATANVSDASQVAANLSLTPGSGVILSNYSFSPTITITGSTITPAPLVAQIINNPTKVYDAGTSAAGANSNTGLLSSNYQLRGFIGSESITVSHSGGTYGDKNAGVQSISTDLVFGDFTAGSGTALSNYAIPHAALDTALHAVGSGTITPIALNVTGVTTTDKTYDKSTYITTTGGSISTGVLSGDNVQLTTGHGDTATPDVNAVPTTPQTVTATGYALSGADGANYRIVQPIGLTVNITKANVNLTVQKTYDGTNDASSTVSGIQYNFTGVYNGDSIGVAPTGTFSQSDVGTGLGVTLTNSGLTGASANNYQIATTSGTITKANLTATLADQTKTYDGTTGATLASGAITVSGVHGETGTVTSLPTGATYNTADAGTNTKTVTADLTGATLNATGNGGFKASNYNALPTTVTNTHSTIDQAPLTVTLADQSKTYDGTTAVTPALTSGQFTVTGLVHGETLTITQTVGTYTDPNAGTNNKTVNAALRTGATNFFTGGGATTQFNAANYKINGVSSGDVVATNTHSTIIPSGLTLTLTKVQKVYDGTTALPAVSVSGAYTLTGRQGSDTVDLATISGNYASANVSNAIKITMTGYTLTGAQASNYTINALDPNNTIGVITKAPLNISVSATKSYDGLVSYAGLTNGNYSITGLVNGETVQINQANGTFSDKNVATANKTITANLGDGNFVNGSTAFNIGNYSYSASVSGAGTITARSLSATLAAQTKVYDANTNASGLTAASYTITGLQNGETLQINRTSGAYNSKDVASATTVSVANLVSGDFTGGNTFVASNYVLPTSASGAGTITVRPVSVSGATANNKVYDSTTADTLNSGSATLSAQSGATGYITGDAVTLVSSGATGTFASKNVGTGIGVTASGFTITGGDAGNYSLSQPTGLVANITVRPVSVSNVTADNKVYDGNTSDTLNTGSAALSAQSGATGYITGDAVTLVSSGAAGTFADKNVANGIAVTASGFTLTGGDAANYVLSQPTGLTANIIKRVLGTTLAAQTKVYDGNTNVLPALTSASFGLSNFASGESATINQTVGTYDNANVGSGNKTVTAALTAANFTGGPGFNINNYSFSSSVQNLVSSITPATLNLTIDLTHVVKVYDGTTALPTLPAAYTLSGVVSGDQVNVASASGAYRSPNVGNGIAMDISSVTLGGAQSANYVVNPVPAEALIGEITPLTLTAAIINNPTKVYDGTTTALLGPTNFSLTGFVGGQGASVTQTAGLYASPNAGSPVGVTATLASADFTANAGTLLSNYVLPTLATGPGVISPRPITAAIIGNPSKDFDGTTSATLTPDNYQLTGLLPGQTLSVTQTAGTYNDPNAGDRTVTAALNPGFFTPGAGTLLGNYSLPANAAGPGQIRLTPVIVQTGEPSLFSFFTAALAARGVSLLDAGPVQRLVRASIMTMATPRIYIPFPAEGALSTWKGNGFGSLPIVVDQTTNAARVVSIDGNVATQSGPPMINNTEQVLLTGVRNKQYRIIITSQAGNEPSLASQ